MKKILGLCLLAMMTTVLSANAQRSRERGDEKERTERRAAFLAKQMKLDETTTNWFTPLYVEMQDTLQAVRRSVFAKSGEKEERNARRSMEKMTDEEAVARVEKSLLAAEQENKIKREYYRKFSEKLSGKQLFVIFVTPQRSNMNRMPQRNGNGGGGFPGGGFPGGGFPGGPGGGF